MIITVINNNNNIAYEWRLLRLISSVLVGQLLDECETVSSDLYAPSFLDCRNDAILPRFSLFFPPLRVSNFTLLAVPESDRSCSC